MNRMLTALLATLAFVSASVSGHAADLTPDAAYKLAAGELGSRYARRFPNDDRAKEAKAAIKRLAGA